MLNISDVSDWTTNFQDGKIPAVLCIQIIQTRLRITHGGQLSPWLGPAMRGTVARAFKNAVCRFDPEIRDTRWVYCTGCPHLNECIYGQCFEPDPPANAAVMSGREDAARGIVLSPQFPAPERASVGDSLDLTAVLVGRAAETSWEGLADAVAEAGCGPGLGPDHVRFDAGPWQARPQGLAGVDLPMTVDSAASGLPAVRVELMSPLLMRTRDEAGDRHTLERPRFADLLRASLRTVGGLFALHEEPLPADFAALKAASETVNTLEADFVPFQQRKWSNRTAQRYDIHGITGSACYGPMPLALLPWLYWGGLLCSGTHRVAGAGAWQLTLV